MTAVVEARRAAKNFGHVEALLPTDLTIGQGEIVALLGPNGAGKTTFISLMLGVRKPTAGSVTLFGLDPRDRRARSRCGVMLQESGVPEFLRLSEIVDQFRSYYAAPLALDTTLEMAGLQDKSASLIHTLSGGQRQRMYFALAICGDPQALFLDEPTVGMDVEARRNFWRRLRDFAAAGRTLLLTTHYIEEADAVADRIIVIDKGRVIADAPPRVLKASVESKRVTFDASRQIGEAEFAGLPVRRIVQEDGRVSIFTADPQALLRGLFARGFDLPNLEVVGASLEDAVVGLTEVRHG
ncbi:MAG TPA: ABC transporter ATP-binding protein [Candidatus Eremiobacteraceae bacterium]|nr:ABC transporter ATP-binding protein [Candidatus Eremiobacteraceae bacterium]